MTRRALGWGVLVVAAYVVVGVATTNVFPVRPLFDGLAPPMPYRWVSPPPDLRDKNQPPESTEQDLPLKPEGNDEASIATLDSQATLIIPQGTFKRVGEARSIKIKVTPKDPSQYGPPPERLSYAANAYLIEATLQPGGAAAQPAGELTILLSYPLHATKIAQQRGSTWSLLPSTAVPAAMQVFAKTRQLGAVVPVGPPRSTSLRWWTLGIASGIAAILGVAFGIRERRRLARMGTKKAGR